MSGAENEKDPRADTNCGAAKQGIIGKIFGPVGNVFGWISKGASKQPVCRT